MWKFRNLDLGGGWGWRGLQPEWLDALVARIREWERMTWGEIERKVGRSGSHNHLMPCGRICPRARERLREIKLDDLAELYSFRLQGAARIWGYRVDATFYVLWWDPEHSVYPLD